MAAKKTKKSAKKRAPENPATDEWVAEKSKVSDPTPDSDRAFRIAQLAATLMAGRLASMQDVALGDPQLDKEFCSALRRAELLLPDLEKKIDVAVFASQLFDRDEYLSAEQIAERFRVSGWGRGLSSKTTVAKKMRDVRKEIKLLKEIALERLRKGDELLGPNDGDEERDAALDREEDKCRKLYEVCFKKVERGSDSVSKYLAKRIFSLAQANGWLNDLVRSRPTLSPNLQLFS